MKFDSSVLTNIKNKYEDMEKRNDYNDLLLPQNLELLYDLTKEACGYMVNTLTYVEWYEFTKMAFYKYEQNLLQNVSGITEQVPYTFEQWISRQVQVLNEY